MPDFTKKFIVEYDSDTSLRMGLERSLFRKHIQLRSSVGPSPHDTAPSPPMSGSSSALSTPYDTRGRIFGVVASLSKQTITSSSIFWTNVSPLFPSITRWGSC
ncbi:hypothetical protein GUJ93_ZPchr0002g25909 [Zizania palustris]|uniref:Uncharacterized protein n=1 Tax=Zizania palustris TaxID=103762 RepID=A0A8J5V579_ZIZPA|nr:hypothetical protein GUJ93_ZPchr0002g25909 [Zizania palustris]